MLALEYLAYLGIKSSPQLLDKIISNSIYQAWSCVRAAKDEQEKKVGADPKVERFLKPDWLFMEVVRLEVVRLEVKT